MRPSKTLAVLKGFLDSYHHPLPLGNREARELYQALTSSFRRQLDKELGWTIDHHQESSSPSSSSSSSSSSSAKPQQAAPPQGRPIGHQHLRSILSNPLFSYNASKPQQLLGSREKDPMDIFNEAVSKGLMTPLRAAGCLKVKHREIMQSPAMDPVAAMASSGAGRMVLEWLQASGHERHLSFIGDGQPLLAQLMPFLLAEGLEPRVWTWFEMLVQRAHSAQASLQPVATKGDSLEAKATVLLQTLVQSKYKGAASMDDAYACLAQAQEIRPWPQDSRLPRYMESAWHRVTWESTVLAWKHLSKASPRLFESFCKIASGNLDLSKPRADNPKSRYKFELAHLALHHPTDPNPTEALRLLLEDESTWSTWSKKQEKDKGSRVAPNPGTLRLRSLGLDTIRICAQLGETTQAETLIHKMASFMGQDFRLHSNELDDRYPLEMFSPGRT